MKHIDFTTTKGDFLVIEDDRMDYDAIHDSKFKHALYQLIGGIQDITEEQAKDVVDCLMGSARVLFKDYKNKGRSLDNSIESINSLLEANGVVFENPVKEKYFLGSEELLHHANEIKIKEAQSKVWNKQQTYLFKKI